MEIKANGERLWNTLMEMAKIGPGEHGGNRRLALSDEDIEGRTLFQKWVDEAGCTIRQDTMGTKISPIKSRRKIWKYNPI